MIDLLTYITTGITGVNEIDVRENLVGEMHEYTISAPKEVMGLLIGKEGRTIRAIRSLARARAIIEQISISVKLEERE